jgi:hypothetical protein
MVWFALMSFWAAGSLLVLAFTLFIAINPDSRTSVWLILGTLLLAIVTTTTARSVRRVTKRAAWMTRVFGVLSGVALILMTFGTTATVDQRDAVQAVCSGWLAIGVLSWLVARRIDREVRPQ